MPRNTEALLDGALKWLNHSMEDKNSDTHRKITSEFSMAHSMLSIAISLEKLAESKEAK